MEDERVVLQSVVCSPDQYVSFPGKDDYEIKFVAKVYWEGQIEEIIEVPVPLPRPSLLTLWELQLVRDPAHEMD